MSEIETVERYETDTVFGKQVELKAKKSPDGFISSWSFDYGENWNQHLRRYKSADDAIHFARLGAFIAHVHNRALERRGDS